MTTLTKWILTEKSKRLSLFTYFSNHSPNLSRLPIDDSYSPLLHRIESAVRYRAVHPNEPILEPSEQLLKLAHPDKELVKNSNSSLEKLVSAANVKKSKLLYPQRILKANARKLIRSLQFHQKPRAASACARLRNLSQVSTSMPSSSRSPSVPRYLPKMRFLNSSRCSRAPTASTSFMTLSSKWPALSRG